MAQNKKNQLAQEMSEATSKYEAFFAKNKKAILIAIAAVIIVIAAIIFYNNFVAKPRAEKAATMLAKMEQLFEQQQYEQALKGNGADAPGFTQIASDYSGTDAGNLANYFAGICYAKTGKWQDAASYLEKFNTKKDLFARWHLEIAMQILRNMTRLLMHLRRLQVWVTKPQQMA